MPAETVREGGTGPAAVLWDMDGTLIDSEKVWDRSLSETARWLGGELSAAARTETIGGNMALCLEILFRDVGVAPTPQRTAAARDWLIARTAELFAEGLPWRPGAEEALLTVRDAGWPMALVTNTGRLLTEMALESIGREHFAVTVCGDEVPRGKPHPDPYLRAAELLGVPAAECLAVEDSATGTTAAERAGAVVLVVPCEVAVPAAPSRVHRESLVGLRPADVARAYTRVRGGRPS
ncbi:HAD family hydrolase [Pseudonocardia bannensis]|uniref:HAD family phosphatase n=1 Tax=Pseudonocardia bannensis TaxID=630973 RepID=A0A848DQZ5_9PSEU|nr:HAD family phosphatase [Pseudonocardia bannensis]NMH94856.1 HAD family phosphatase [Pseudonocardia bannensis]